MNVKCYKMHHICCLEQLDYKIFFVECNVLHWGCVCDRPSKLVVMKF